MWFDYVRNQSQGLVLSSQLLYHWAISQATAYMLFLALSPTNVAQHTWLWDCSDRDDEEQRDNRHTYTKAGVRWTVHSDGDTPATQKLSAVINQ